jgi:pyruvate/2-oxoglutarate dehydrogenase complex dihydrolipoamide dehydrogenase (E3) component
MAEVLRRQTLSEAQGFLKAMVSAENDETLGFTAIGNQAGELMGVVQTAMLANLPYTALRDAISTHPTTAEGLSIVQDQPCEDDDHSLESWQIERHSHLAAQLREP